MKHLKRFKILIPLMVMICMLFAGADTASAATANNFLKGTDTLKIVSKDAEYTIIDGVYEAEYTINNTKLGGNVKVHVLLVKPDAKASFKPVIPGYYKEGQTAADRKAMSWSDSSFKTGGLTSMIKEYQSAGDATRVLAAINGDFPNSITAGGNGKAPRGSVVIDGVERVSGKHSNEEYFFGSKGASGTVNIAQKGENNSAFEEALTAPQYILRNGKLDGASEEYINNVPQHRQRTGAAVRANGEILLITAESGMLMEQLAELMKASDCVNGVNYDGGGSINFQTDRGDGITRRTPAFKEMGTYAEADDTYGDRYICSGLMLVADDEPINKVPDVEELGTKITTSADTYLEGTPIDVTAYSDVPGAWVSILTESAFSEGNLTAIEWYYTYGTEGTQSWENGVTYNIGTDGANGAGGSLVPGKYVVAIMKYAADGVSHEVLDHTTIEVTENPNLYYTLKTNKDVYTVKEPIKVTATSNDMSAWIGIYEHGTQANGKTPSFFWYYNSQPNDGVPHKNGGEYNLLEQVNNYEEGNTNLLNNATRMALLDETGTYLMPGTYDVRVYARGGYTVAVDENGNPIEKTITIVEDPNTEYAITYKDGSDTLKNLEPTKYTYGEAQEGSIALPATVEKTGHVFKGWYDNADCNGNAVTSISQVSKGAKTFYAKFDKIKYEVTFDTDGGSAVESQTVPYGEKASRPAENPTKADYNFIGWVTEDGEAYDFDQAITGATNIYASWQLAQANEHQVTFNANGGSYVESVFVEDGNAVDKPEDPTKAGYEFVKWVTEDEEEYDFVNTSVTGPITLYATWTPVKYTITFDVDGGQAIESKEYTIETATFELPQTTKDGYTFKGWADAEGKTYTEIAKGSTGSLELTAQWQKKDSLAVNKTEFALGEPIKVTAYSEKNAAWVGLYKDGENYPDAKSYYWSYINYDGKDLNNKEFNLIASGNRQNGDGRAFTAGTYHVILFYNDDQYLELDRKTITISDREVEVTVEGELTVSGASRTDKPYDGPDDEYEGNYPNYYYGDSITVKATVSGEGSENAWVGLVEDADYINGDVIHKELGTNWFYVKDFEGQEVNLCYVSESKLQSELNFPEKGFRWVVLFTEDYQVIDSVPIFIRTYNMNWLEGEGSWGDSVKNNIVVEQEWVTRVANGEDQKPVVTIKRINGHFGYDKNGKEITEHVLKQGEDYTLEYPETSKEPDDYTIKVIFPTEDKAEVKYLNDPKKVDYYGFANGIKYYIKNSEEEKVITYELNGGNFKGSYPTEYIVGEEVELKAPGKVLHIFGGWYTTPDFQEGTQVTKITKDFKDNITLYAKWIAEDAEDTTQYTIKYVLNGGDNSINNPDRYTGETDISIAPAKKAGYTFIGWFYDPNFEHSADIIKATKNPMNLTLYAKFVKNNFEITTEVVNGTITDEATVKNGSSFTVEYASDRGYLIKSVTVDGQAVDISQFSSSYTFDKVDSDHHIAVVFEKPALAAPAKVTPNLRTATGGYDDITVKWSAVEGADSYAVYYKKGSAKKYTKLTTTAGTSATKKNLSDGARYYFKVVPCYMSGDELFETDVYKTGNVYTLKKISTPKVKRSGSKVKVSWTNINGETGYQISKHTKKSKTKVVSTYKTTKGKYKKISAKKGTKYYYKVRAYKVVDGKKVYGPWSKVKAYRR